MAPIHKSKTAQRVRELSHNWLLDGYDTTPAEASGFGFANSRQHMVVIRSLGARHVSASFTTLQRGGRTLLICQEEDCTVLVA